MTYKYRYVFVTWLCIVLSLVGCGGGGESAPTSRTVDMSGKWHVQLIQDGTTTPLDVGVSLLKSSGVVTGNVVNLSANDCNPCTGNGFMGNPGITSISGKVSGNNFAIVLSVSENDGRYGGFTSQINLTGTMTNGVGNGTFSGLSSMMYSITSSTGTLRMNRSY